jgi:23S rRNA pseudouridine1911/1915/1917 synthase
MADDSTTTHVVTESAPRRLDAFLHALLPGLSRRLVHTVIAEGAVRVNGRPGRKGTLLEPGDRVTAPQIGPLAPDPTLELPVVHADEAVVVVDKPGGMPGHALDPRQRGTVASFLLTRWPEMAAVGEPLAPGLAHRLDTGTSGLLAAARTPEAFAALREAFRAGRVRKRYLAVVAGSATVHTTIEVGLRHDPRDRRRMIPAGAGTRGWRARSAVDSVAAYGDRQLVQVTIETGVTHQVRAHLALLGHPVLGDDLYGGPPAVLPPERHALHAAALAFPHPTRGELLSLERPLPADLAMLLS